MLKNTILVLLLFYVISPSYAMPGKLVLVNGHAFSGDIRKLEDGSYWLTNKSGSIKFEASEVKYVKITSKKDTVSENFINALKITPGQARSTRPAGPSKYDNLIHREASKNNIDPALVKAVIRQESNYNRYDVSSKGACGLMQLMPETAKLLGVKSIFSPEENIEAGTRFLRYMLDTFDGNLELGLAAYNAGPGTVKRYGRVPPYKETKNYVTKVIKYMRDYSGTPGVNSFIDEKGCLNLYNER